MLASSGHAVTECVCTSYLYLIVRSVEISQVPGTKPNGRACFRFRRRSAQQEKQQQQERNHRVLQLQAKRNKDTDMAHLSPPPSPPVGQTPPAVSALNALNASASANLIQRASAFSSVLGQKWNPRDLLLLYNPLFYSGAAAFPWPQFLLPQQPITPVSPNLNASSRDYTLTPEKEEIVDEDMPLNLSMKPSTSTPNARHAALTHSINIWSPASMCEKETIDGDNQSNIDIENDDDSSGDLQIDESFDSQHHHHHHHHHQHQPHQHQERQDRQRETARILTEYNSLLLNGRQSGGGGSRSSQDYFNYSKISKGYFTHLQQQQKNLEILRQNRTDLFVLNGGNDNNNKEGVKNQNQTGQERSGGGAGSARLGGSVGVGTSESDTIGEQYGYGKMDVGGSSSTRPDSTQPHHADSPYGSSNDSSSHGHSHSIVSTPTGEGGKKSVKLYQMSHFVRRRVVNLASALGCGKLQRDRTAQHYPREFVTLLLLCMFAQVSAPAVVAQSVIYDAGPGGFILLLGGS
uniref:Uncharacterized protein n=1 Tax=Anopheles melas TaxID=34690 RepID=A0A182U7R1_9DIPT